MTRSSGLLTKQSMISPYYARWLPWLEEFHRTFSAAFAAMDLSHLKNDQAASELNEKPMAPGEKSEAA
jgi:hypothetical protein